MLCVLFIPFVVDVVVDVVAIVAHLNTLSAINSKILSDEERRIQKLVQFDCYSWHLADAMKTISNLVPFHMVNIVNLSVFTSLFERLHVLTIVVTVNSYAPLGWVNPTECSLQATDSVPKIVHA